MRLCHLYYYKLMKRVEKGGGVLPWYFCPIGMFRSFVLKPVVLLRGSQSPQMQIPRISYIYYYVQLTLFLTRKSNDRFGKLSKNELGSFKCPKDQKCHLVQQKYYQRIELFVYINTRDENLTIREAHQLTLKAHCGSCVWDIVTISVLYGVLLP